MQFKITKDGKEILLDEYKLYEQLMMVVLDKEKDNDLKGGDKILEVMAQWLATTGFIMKHELLSSLFLAFKLGYYWKAANIKQTIEIVDKETEEK